MASFDPQISWYLERYRKGDGSTAFHGLTQLDPAALPELVSKYHAAVDTRLRVFLLEVIWQHRQQSVVPILAEALFDPEPQVWKEAMDGLVALASPSSVEALRAARTRGFSQTREAEEFRLWLEEAIEQAETAVLSV